MKNTKISFLLSLVTLAGAKSIDKSKKYCTGCDVVTKHNDIYWGFENNDWCGM